MLTTLDGLCRKLFGSKIDIQKMNCRLHEQPESSIQKRRRTETRRKPARELADRPHDFGFEQGCIDQCLTRSPTF